LIQVIARRDFARYHTLAYVEWFTPFTRPTMPLRLLKVAYALKNGKPTGSVINIESIRRSIHLIPKLNKPVTSRRRSKTDGLQVGVNFSADDAMDKHKGSFFFNSFLSLDTFQFADGDYELVEAE
jgi:hypothetical protein